MTDLTVGRKNTLKVPVVMEEDSFYTFDIYDSPSQENFITSGTVANGVATLSSDETDIDFAVLYYVIHRVLGIGDEEDVVSGKLTVGT